jgi:hypothetical protein
MTYSFPLALPTHTGLSSIKITMDSAVAVEQSPWDYTTEVQQNQGQCWHFQVALPIMSRADAALWEAFFLKLNGRYGTFLLGHPGEATPRGVATGSPLVDGAGQSGQTLNIKGLTTGVTGIYKAGDWLQLGSGSTARMHKILDDANSDGSGKTSVNLWPNITLAEVQADGATIIVNNVQGVFRMDANVPFDCTTAMLYNHTFTATSQV